MDIPPGPRLSLHIGVLNMSNSKFPERIWLERVPDADDPEEAEDWNLYFKSTGYGVLPDGRSTAICEYTALPTLTEAQCTVASKTANIHQLKSWPEFFEAILDGRKKFDLRFDDRGYAQGDILQLREWNPDVERYTGREYSVLVNYVYSSDQALMPGYVCLGILPLSESPGAGG
jgi:hypothetical protein